MKARNHAEASATTTLTQEEKDLLIEQLQRTCIMTQYQSTSLVNNDPDFTGLNLISSNIGAEGAEALAKVLENNNTLTQLNLWQNDIGTDDPNIQRLEYKLAFNKYRHVFITDRVTDEDV